MADRDFRSVLAAEGVTNFGSMLSRLALPWLAAIGLQATPMQMAALVVADVAAGLVGSLALGGWVDRCDKRRVMRGCDAARAVLFAALAASVWAGVATMALLALAAAAHGVLTMGFELARSAWMAQRIDAAGLPRANAQLSATASVAETVAFALGGWLYQGLGAAWSLAVDAVSFVLSARFLRGVSDAPAIAPAAGPDRAGVLRAAVDDAVVGLRVLAAHPGLRTLAGAEALLASAMAVMGTGFMLFVTREAGYDTGVLGMVFAAGGLGALAGAAWAPRLGRALGPGGAMALGLAGVTLGNACVPLAAGGGVAGIVLLVAHQLVGDGGQVVHEVHDRTLRQTLVEPAKRARVDAGLRALGQGATLAGALAGGIIGERLGLLGVLVAAVMLYGGAALWVGWRRRWLGVT